MSKSFKVDLSGQKFGQLTVLEFDLRPETTTSYWMCECECGNIKSIASSKFKSGHTKSCGCLTTDNITGKKFGMLTALYPTDRRDNSGNKYWMFQCECGETTEVGRKSVKTGNTQSCGCLLKNNLQGQRFGKLVAVEPTDKRIDRRIIWRCLCDCNNYCEAQSSNLVSGHTQSCGCISSIGEQKIQSILQENNFSYKKEKIFSDLIDVKPLRFDFAILKNGSVDYLIEYHGVQHYENTWKTNHDTYEDYIRRDRMKEEYCKLNNIPLIIIPYWELDNLNIDMLDIEKSTYKI